MTDTPHRWPRVRIVNKPKTPVQPDAPGGAVPGWATKIFVDGVDMSHGVSSVQVTAHHKDVVRAVIEVLPTEIEFDDVVPEISPPSRELLIALGWTPPASGEEVT